MYIAALVLEFHNSILTNKIHCTIIMKCKLPIKQIKMKEVLGGGHLNLASLNCAFLPRACKYELKVIFYFEAALLSIILVASLKKVYSCILGRVVTIRLIIEKDKTLVAKKELQ